MTELINRIFGPPLRTIFDPFNRMFESISPDTAYLLSKIFVVLLFVIPMIWVFLLKKEYVNIDAPNKRFWNDLRFWTIISMTPQIIIYLWL